MPAILRVEDEKRWLDTDLEREEVEAMLKPYDESQMQARTISKLITARDKGQQRARGHARAQVRGPGVKAGHAVLVGLF